MLQPIKVTIEGDYWDCQIYRGRLYLWTFNGEVIVYNWDNLVDSIEVEENERLAVTCALSRGDYLYNPNFYLLFENTEIKNILRRQFETLSSKEIHYNEHQISKFLRGKQGLPTPELPIDTDFYKSNIYSADQTGLYCITAHRSSKYQVSTRPRKLWDCPLLSIKIGNRGNIAVSAGNEGLFEYLPDDFITENSVEQISKKHSSFSNWAFSSIYSSSFVDGSYLAPYFFDDSNMPESSKQKRNSFFEDDIPPNHFVSKEIIQDSRIFGENTGLSWACNEKFYSYYDRKITIVNFIQGKLKDGDDSAFTDKREITLSPWKGDVISTGTSYFGTIVECENAIVVLMSDGSSLTIPGKAVRWRTYPRSIRYENHLHIIKEDSIEIYSFNNDYFIDQRNKNYGIEYRAYNQSRMRWKP